MTFEWIKETIIAFDLVIGYLKNKYVPQDIDDYYWDRIKHLESNLFIYENDVLGKNQLKKISVMAKEAGLKVNDNKGFIIRKFAFTGTREQFDTYIDSVVELLEEKKREIK